MAEQLNTTPDGKGSDFPKFPLEEALAVPNALQRNGGQPLTAIDMATAIGRSPGSSTLRMLAAASSAYGLSGGSYKTQFTLADGGRAIIEPTSAAEEARGLVAAALQPPTYRKAYDYYKGKKFPEEQFFINTAVREFGVQQKQAAKFVEIFTANMRFVGLIKETPGGDWLAKDAIPQPTSATVTETEVADLEAEANAGEDGGAADAVEQAPPTSPAATTRKRRPNRMFVGHGKNKKPLTQLTKTLDNLGIPYLVAEDEPNVGRPISKKVRDTMDECGAAILIFSADEEFFDKDRNSIWKPSENVSHELGAAAVMYDDRVILFKEESVQLASNYSGSGYIPFEKDHLDAKVNDLLRELMGLKILRMSLEDDE
jgi:predicted nucleotide-binding protein